MAIQAEVQHAHRPPGVPAAECFRQWARALDCPQDASVCIRVVDDAEMEALNTRYRGQSGATNVLAFETDSPERDRGHLGDVMICAPVVFREAERYGQTAEARFAHMTVHGLLHLMGHDHGEAEAARRMEGLERMALARLGYPDPYEAA